MNLPYSVALCCSQAFTLPWPCSLTGRDHKATGSAIAREPGSGHIAADHVPAAEGRDDHTTKEPSEKRGLPQIRCRLAGQHDVWKRPREDACQNWAVRRARNVLQRT